MFGLVTEDKVDLIVAKINEIYQKQATKNNSLAENIKKIEDLSLADKDRSEKNLAELRCKIEQQEQSLTELKKMLIQTGKLVHKIAVQKNMEREETPKTPEEEYKDNLEALEEKEVEHAAPIEEIISYCVTCNKETQMVDPEYQETNLGRFWIGKCGKCGSPKNKAIE